MEPPLLELKNVTKVFRVGGGISILPRKTITAVDDVSFIISSDHPTIVALVGESGSGKSTIAKIILGLIDRTSGEILYKGKDVTHWLKDDPKGYIKEVQAIFQDPYEIYNPFYKIERVLHMAVSKFKLAPSREKANSMIIDAMGSIGLRPEDLLGRYPHQLSGGERQRMMLARIFLIKPKFLIADEPVSMIDASLRAIFLDTLRDFKDRLNMSCLYITHDLNIAYYVADEMIVLCYGKVVETGQASAIIDKPLHPYTQLLVSSIPVPDPKKRWAGRLDIQVDKMTEQRVERGCVYQLRCPHVMPICREKEVPMFRVEQERETACFLYDESLKTDKKVSV